MEPKQFMATLDDAAIVAAIRVAEARSRGEIRVHVAAGAVDDATAAAAAAFLRLGMRRTAERNGVLVFVAPASRTLAVVGDAGVNERCPAGFWDEVVAAVRADFLQGRYTEGLVHAVATVGAELARHFPRAAGAVDRDELPDAISRD